MKVVITPTKVVGTVKIPPSKSMAHRAIICAALANGKSTISNIAFSDDILATINGLISLGAKIDIFDDYVEVTGIKDFNNIKNYTIDCKESGSTLRFLIPIFSLCNEKVTFKGKNRLLIRPQDIYKDIFLNKGLEFYKNDTELCIKGSLSADAYELPGDVSSQFISGLLFTLPLLENDSTITIKEPFESRSYVDLTLQMLQEFGINIKYLDNNTLFIKGSQKYIATNHEVEGDFSQFAFFAVLSAINNTIECTGLKHSSLQGDKEVVDILKRFGAHIEPIKNGYKVHKSKLSGGIINLENCPDLGPILMVLCANADGESKLINASRLRIKESDRIEAPRQELLKFGVNIRVENDDIYISGQDKFVINDNLLGHKDHRIVMCLAILSTIADKPVTIYEAEYINKSYPNFFDDLEKLGVKVTKYE